MIGKCRNEPAEEFEFIVRHEFSFPICSGSIFPLHSFHGYRKCCGKDGEDYDGNNNFHERDLFR